MTKHQITPHCEVGGICPGPAWKSRDVLTAMHVESGVQRPGLHCELILGAEARAGMLKACIVS